MIGNDWLRVRLQAQLLPGLRQGAAVFNLKCCSSAAILTNAYWHRSLHMNSRIYCYYFKLVLPVVITANGLVIIIFKNYSKFEWSYHRGSAYSVCMVIIKTEVICVFIVSLLGFCYCHDWMFVVCIMNCSHYDEVTEWCVYVIAVYIELWALCWLL